MEFQACVFAFFEKSFLKEVEKYFLEMFWRNVSILFKARAILSTHVGRNYRCAIWKVEMQTEK